MSWMAEKSTTNRIALQFQVKKNTNSATKKTSETNWKIKAEKNQMTYIAIVARNSTVHIASFGDCNCIFSSLSSFDSCFIHCCCVVSLFSSVDNNSFCCVINDRSEQKRCNDNCSYPLCIIHQHKNTNVKATKICELCKRYVRTPKTDVIQGCSVWQWGKMDIL